MAYNSPITSSTNFGVMEVGSNLTAVAGVVNIPQSVSATANPTFATLTSTGAVTDSGNRVITGLAAGTNVTITGTAPNLIINATTPATPTVPTRLVALTGAIFTTDYYVGVTAVGPITLTLPAGVQGAQYVVKSEFSNLGNVLIVGNTILDTVEGLATPLGITLSAAANASATLIFRGTNWNVV